MATKSGAQQARAIMNRYKLRLGEKFDKGDPLALAAMNAELAELRDRQELERERIQTNSEQRRFGKGGKLPTYINGGTFLPGTGRFQQGVAPTLTSPNLPTNFGTGMNFNTGEGFLDTGLGLLDTGLGFGDGEAPAGDDPFKSRVPWIGAAATAVGSILANRKLDLPEYKYEEYDPKRVAPRLVDYSRSREQTLRERDLANALIRRRAAGTGSQAGLMENIIAGTTGTQRVAGTQFGQSLEQEQNVNAQIRNEAAARQAQMDAQAAQMNMRGKLYENQIARETALIDDQRRRNMITGITDSITGYTKDRLAANQYDQMLEMMAPENYQTRAGKDSLFRRIFQISPDMKINFRNTGDLA